MSNPPTIFQCISATKDVVVALSAAFTATVAFRGLDKWRRELRGKADFDTARDVVRALYKVREALTRARSPLISGGEFPEGYHRDFHARSDEEEAQALMHVYSNRWRPVADALGELGTAALGAEAIWGPQIREKVLTLRLCAFELFGAMEDRVGDVQSGGQRFRNRHLKDDATWDALHASHDGSNPLDVKITHAINELEDLLRPHLVAGRR